jgi:hypothetical protein
VSDPLPYASDQFLSVRTPDLSAELDWDESQEGGESLQGWPSCVRCMYASEYVVTATMLCLVLDTGVVEAWHLCGLRCAYVTLLCEIFDRYLKIQIHHTHTHTHWHTHTHTHTQQKHWHMGHSHRKYDMNS